MKYPLTLVSVYVLNSHQLHFLRRLLKKVSSVKYGNSLMCGDFNATVDPRLESTSSADYFLYDPCFMRSRFTMYGANTPLREILLSTPPGIVPTPA